MFIFFPAALEAENITQDEPVTLELPEAVVADLVVGKAVAADSFEFVPVRPI